MRKHWITCVSLLPLLGACASSSADRFTGDRTAAMADIDARREAIEARKESLTRRTLSTDGLREQIQQKWSQIDFYLDGDEVVRIKTYPHEAVSTRTEEFYFDDGELIYACIQDDGATGEATPLRGKEYFYADGTFVGERNNTDEAERSIRNSDEERLEQEALEYLELAPSAG